MRPGCKSHGTVYGSESRGLPRPWDRALHSGGSTGTCPGSRACEDWPNGDGVHGFVHETPRIERNIRDRHELPKTQARQPSRPGSMTETKRDVRDLRRAAHNPATADRHSLD